MPVIDGVFVPRSLLTPAELHVDFVSIDNHVVSRRLAVEKAALPKAHRLAAAMAQLGDIYTPHEALTQTLADALELTAHFGYRQAQRELGQLRVGRTVTAAVVPPSSASRLAEIVRGGLGGVSLYVRDQALIVTEAVVAAIVKALRGQPNPTLGLLVARRDAQRVLHNGVLDLVGTTLNVGRTIGAAESNAPPRFALRSEQLDNNTCDPCEHLHGTIVQFGTPEYFAVMPPVGCLGGGRCRALMVFGDDDRHVAPELLAA
jgi:hypothetical protein